MKKIPIILAVVAVLGLGGWYVFSSESEAARIDAIAQETNQLIASYSTSSRQAVERKLGKIQISFLEKSDENTEVLGISFATPWGSPISVNPTNSPTAVELNYSDGRKINVVSGPIEDIGLEKFFANFEGTFLEASQSPVEIFRNQIGEEIDVHSVLAYALNTTPDDLVEAKTVEEARARSQSLIIKAGNLLARTGDIYQFRRDSLKGFVSVDTAKSVILIDFLTNEKSFTFLIRGNANNVSKEAAEKIIATLDTGNSNKVQEQADDPRDYFAE